MINEKKDACYHKVKSRYSVWPSAYASGALVKCRKKGAKNWGNSRKDEALHTAYFNFAASLLEAVSGDKKWARRAYIDRVTGTSEKQRRADSVRKDIVKRGEERAAASAAGRRVTQGVQGTLAAKNKLRKMGGKAPTTPQAGIGGKSTSVAAGDQEGGEVPDRRTDLERRKELRQRLKDKVASEQEARAAARGTTRRRVTYKIGTDPETGERGIVADREAAFGFNKKGIKSYVTRLGRAKGEQAADSPLQAYNAAKDKLKAPVRSVMAGRAKAKARREKLDYSHTEYQRIGDILAEAKGVMPKKFSVKSGDKSAAGGLTAKGVKRYRAANPGSKLKTAVTTKPSKLKKGSKSAKRRKSFCARMGGMKKRLTSSKTANDPNSRINKALRKWNC